MLFCLIPWPWDSTWAQDLENQGYEYLPALNNPQAMLANIRAQLQTLNKVQFADGEWARFVETYLDKKYRGTKRFGLEGLETLVLSRVGKGK